METNNVLKLGRHFQEVMRLLISKDGFIDRSVIDKKGWVIGIVDDPQFTDESAFNMHDALNSVYCDRFYVCRIEDLFKEEYVDCFEIKNTIFDIEKLGDPCHFTFALDNIIIFSLPICFVVIRTGDIRYALHSGTKDFVSTSSGLIFKDKSIAYIEAEYDDDFICSYYRIC